MIFCIVFTLLLVGCTFSVQNDVNKTPFVGSEDSTPSPTTFQTTTRVPAVSFADEPYLTATPEIETMVPGESGNITLDDVENAGKVHIPILIFHHVSESIESRYSLTPAIFSKIMLWLSDTGYKTISMQDFVDAISGKSQLPEKAIIITFDDGNQNVYNNAFPIMEELGFSGVICVVANRIGVAGFLSADDLKTLNESGWDICNHSMTHMDLNIDHERLRFEMGDSRKRIQMVTGLEVNWFAYPFGKADKTVLDWAKRLGYAGAFGLGITSDHSLESLYYLSRIEISSDTSLTQLSGMIN